jgi:hypothetical protein
MPVVVSRFYWYVQYHIVAVFTQNADQSLMKRLEIVNYNNGGKASASSATTNFEPEGAFIDGECSWGSDWVSDGNNCSEWIQRDMTSHARPAILALQDACGRAPTKFKVVGKEEREEQWVTLVEADEVVWMSNQWQFWAIKERKSVNAIRLEARKCMYGRTFLMNVRLFC